MLQLTFPEPQHREAEGPQFSVDERISLLVTQNLVSPVSNVRFRNVAAPRAAMPETAVQENGNSFIREKEVRDAWNALFVEPPAGDGVTDKGSPETNFRRSVPERTNCPHVLTPAILALVFRLRHSKLV